MKKTAVMLAIVVAGIFGFGLVLELEGAEWVKYGETAAGEHFYDKTSIQRESGGIVKMWDETMLSPQEQERIIEYGKGAQPNTHWQDVIRERRFTAIDCNNREKALLSVVFYDKDMRVVSSDNVSVDGGTWRPISLPSLGDLLYGAVCTGNDEK
jgi:hypothetical protein